MYTKSEAFYDAIYGTMKDYAKEAALVHTMIQQYKRTPGNNLLDVACGTGRHIAFLQRDYKVEGLDLDEEMLVIARQRNPGIIFHHADMVDFEIGHTFDVIVCLFSSIGYIKTVSRLHQTLRTMHQHLQPGGIVLIEPWLTPEQFEVGHLAALFVNEPDLKIARMNRSDVREGVSIMNFHYLVATQDGIEHFTELHELGLFTRVDYVEAFRTNGFEVVHDADPEKLAGRGLYIGIARG